MDFNPNDVSIKNNQYFGFPYQAEEAEILVLPAPWDVTTSYRDGTSRGPRAILEASYQLDYTSPLRKEAWKTKIGTLEAPLAWYEKSRILRAQAKQIIQALEEGTEAPLDIQSINQEGAFFHQELQELALEWLKKEKKLVVLGGDHSVSLGPILAHAKVHESFSVLHIDAHADLRIDYEGFTHSHASIMNHVKKIPAVHTLVQVGIRDYSPEEETEIHSNPKIHTFFDFDLKRSRASGRSWLQDCQEILSHLEQKVYLSFDIDGLDPRFCPNTGTPVPGGLDFSDVLLLLEALKKAGKTLIGADLVEVAPSKDSDEWDANVGARMLYHICQALK